jgi:hypothetical protein
MKRPSETEQNSEQVLRILKKAAYFSIFSVPDPEQLSRGIPLLPFLPAALYGIEITESPRRHQISAGPPSPTCGFRTSMVGSAQRIARQHLVLNVMPNNYQAGKGRIPPPTLLLPFLSQRFYMSEGVFDFLDPEQSGFRAHASGRFFPATSSGDVYLRIGVVVEILQYLGRLQGLVGNLVVNGYTTPPQIFANNFIIRFVDTAGKLIADTAIPPVSSPVQNPEPNAAFIPVMAELQPESQLIIEPMRDGKKKIHLFQQLRLADNSFDVEPVLRSRTIEREIIGDQRTTLIFDPDDPNEVIPLYSINSEFRFIADNNQLIGSLKANLFEGRAFRTALPELAQPFFRITGFGPFIEGTGQFKDMVGMVSVNGALSLSPGAFSAMYMLRMADPLKRFQAPWTNTS